jgi:hypothetical protein
VIIRDIRDANNLVLPDFYPQHGIISTVDVVISALNGESYGVLEIDSPTLHQYDQHDIDFLTGFANVLADAVALAQKNKAMEALLERQKLLASELQTPCSQQSPHRRRDAKQLRAVRIGRCVAAGYRLNLTSGSNADPYLRQSARYWTNLDHRLE